MGNWMERESASRILEETKKTSEAEKNALHEAMDTMKKTYEEAKEELEKRFQGRAELLKEEFKGLSEKILAENASSLQNSNKEQWEKTLAAVFDDLYGRARDLGGQVSGEHGIGFAKKPFLGKSLSPEVLSLMRGIKQAFDPKNILNPAKIIVE